MRTHYSVESLLNKSYYHHRLTYLVTFDNLKYLLKCDNNKRIQTNLNLLVCLPLTKDEIKHIMLNYHYKKSIKDIQYLHNSKCRDNNGIDIDLLKYVMTYCPIMCANNNCIMVHICNDDYYKHAFKNNGGIVDLLALILELV